MGVNYSHYLIPRDNTVRPEPDRIVAMIQAWIEKGFIVRPQSAPEQDQPQSTSRLLETGARFMRGRETLDRQPAPEPRRGFWTRLWGGAQRVARPDPWMPFSIPPTGESLSALAEPYALIRWKGNSTASYPLETITEPISHGDFRFPHSLIVEISDDFVNPDTDPYGGDARQVSASCSCGCNLAYEATGYLAGERIRRVCPTCGLAFRPQDQMAEIRDGSSGNKTVQPGGLCNRFGIIVYFEKEMPLYRPDSNGQLVETTPKVTDAFMATCSAALGTELNEFRYTLLTS